MYMQRHLFANTQDTYNKSGTKSRFEIAFSIFGFSVFPKNNPKITQGNKSYNQYYV